MDDTSRLGILDHRVQRLRTRILRLQGVSNRISWLRAGIMVAGVLGALVAGYLVSTATGWTVFAITLVVYMIAVYFHRRIEHWLKMFTLARDMTADQRARLNLEWDKLPRPAPAPLGAEALALDLDLTGPHSLHRLLDTTVTGTGSEYLASWLTLSSTQLIQTIIRQDLVRELVPLVRFRERFGLTFRQFDAAPFQGEGLASWLSASASFQRWTRVLAAVTLLAAMNIVLFVLYAGGWIPPLWILSLILYLALYGLNLQTLARVLHGLVRAQAELDQLEPLFRLIENAPYQGRERLARLCAPFLDSASSPSRHVRRIKRLTVAVGLRSNIFIGTIVNLIIPYDFWMAYLADRLSLPLTRVFPGWLKIIYQLDALMAMGSYAYWNPHHTFPALDPHARPTLQVEKLGHPLLLDSRKVRNDFTILSIGELAIITGSNMAGKSTFLKTIGINFCLAYAGGPVDAALFRAVPFRLHTCIHITDSVTDGFSYFYAEVQCLKQLMDKLDAEILPVLFFIDEIFRGTNNRERLEGARAYIEAALGRQGIGLLSTHDLELAHLFEGRPQVKNYHFKDNVSDGRLIFDYTIHPGICPTTNALRIMQMAGLPTGSPAPTSTLQPNAPLKGT